MPRGRPPKSHDGSDAPPTRRRSKARTTPALTRERIAEDMAAFRKAGGRIEKLGVTQTLTRIGTGDDASAAASAGDGDGASSDATRATTNAPAPGRKR